MFPGRQQASQQQIGFSKEARSCCHAGASVCLAQLLWWPPGSCIWTPLEASTGTTATFPTASSLLRRCASCVRGSAIVDTYMLHSGLASAVHPGRCCAFMRSTAAVSVAMAVQHSGLSTGLWKLVPSFSCKQPKSFAVSCHHRTSDRSLVCCMSQTSRCCWAILRSRLQRATQVKIPSCLHLAPHIC